MVGKTINKWYVIKKDIRIRNSRKEYGFLCRCLCGKESFVRKRSLEKEKSKGCLDCHNKEQITNIINKDFGDWKVLKNISNKKCLCECKCGKIKEVFRSSLISGDSTKCRECLYKKTYYGDISKHFFGHIKRGARDRNIEFNITIEYVWKLYIEQNRKCSLTNLDIYFPQKNKADFTASLDRINSNIGYVEGNVQWLHKDLNLMKQKFSQEKFIEYCKLVAKTHNDAKEYYDI